MTRIPLRDFFRNPEQTGFQLSPDGQYLAYLAPYAQRMNIHVRELATAQVTRVTSVTDRDISGFAWVSDTRLAYMRDFGGDENFHLLATNIDGSNDVDLTPFEGVRAQLIDDLKDDPAHVIVGLNKRNAQIFDPYRLDVHTGDLTLIAENPGNITSWMADHEGKLRLAIATDGVNESILYRATEADAFEVKVTTNFKETLTPLFFTFDNQNIYAASNLGRDKTAIVEYDIAAQREVRELFAHDEVDVTSLSYSRKYKVLTTIAYTTWKPMYHFLTKERAALQERLERELTGEIAIVSSNKDEDELLIRTYSDRSLGAYYHYSAANDALRLITKVGEWLPEAALAEMKPISYTSRDGLTIHGYLTLPQGVVPQGLPVVVNPHGGPWVRDNWGFNPEVQFLASRGYAVLQMNYRGSTGYGRAFWEASFKKWGLEMQNDITDGVQWLIQEGIADPKRVAIYGGSYGGYATLAGITLTPEVYACAVDYVGVSNLFTFMNTIPPYWEPFRAMLYEMVGNPEDPTDKVRMEATSPVFHVDQIRVPLLIAQGAKDPRVAQAESDQVVAALRERGVEVQYLLKENEGHGFRNEENRFEFYEAMENFLDKHLA